MVVVIIMFKINIQIDLFMLNAKFLKEYCNKKTNGTST